MWELCDLDAITKIFYFDKKKDLERHCKETTIYKGDFAAFVLTCETGLLPWQHRIHFRDHVPTHLVPTDEEREALSENRVGPLKGKAAKMISKVGQIFEERRYLVGHMFFSPDLSNWHFFYFDQRDLSDRKNHWAQGPHIHLINHLWPNRDAQSLWHTFTSGNVKLSDSLHIKFVDRRHQ